MLWDQQGLGSFFHNDLSQVSLESFLRRRGALETWPLAMEWRRWHIGQRWIFTIWDLIYIYYFWSKFGPKITPIEIMTCVLFTWRRRFQPPHWITFYGTLKYFSMAVNFLISGTKETIKFFSHMMVRMRQSSVRCCCFVAFIVCRLIFFSIAQRRSCRNVYTCRQKNVSTCLDVLEAITVASFLNINLMYKRWIVKTIITHIFSRKYNSNTLC